MTAGMTIGILARHTGTPVETIRYYEREGLLPMPPRTAGNYRLYSDTHRQRLTFIRNCRNLDMALDEIRTLLSFRDDPEANCETVSRVLDEHTGHVAVRIGELESLQQELRRLRKLCRVASATKRCGILDGLTRKPPAPSLRPGNVQGSHRQVQRRKNG